MEHPWNIITKNNYKELPKTATQGAVFVPHFLDLTTKKAFLLSLSGNLISWQPGPLLTWLILMPLSAFGQANGSAETNKLAMSQGVSAPSFTNTTLFSNGFTFQNPVAASYQPGYRMTLAVDGSDTTSGGLDLGLGDSQYGLAIGTYSNGWCLLVWRFGSMFFRCLCLMTFSLMIQPIRLPIECGLVWFELFSL